MRQFLRLGPFANAVNAESADRRDLDVLDVDMIHGYDTWICGYGGHGYVI